VWEGQDQSEDEQDHHQQDDDQICQRYLHHAPLQKNRRIAIHDDASGLLLCSNMSISLSAGQERTKQQEKPIEPKVLSDVVEISYAAIADS
jgi:hypothetical protein